MKEGGKMVQRMEDMRKRKKQNRKNKQKTGEKK